jgi:hypothetical protein
MRRLSFLGVSAPLLLLLGGQQLALAGGAKKLSERIESARLAEFKRFVLEPRSSPLPPLRLAEDSLRFMDSRGLMEGRPIKPLRLGLPPL